MKVKMKPGYNNALQKKGVTQRDKSRGLKKRERFLLGESGGQGYLEVVVRS